MGPAPAGSAALSEEWVYDRAGRVVATRVDAEAGTCMAYDTQGRLVWRSVAAIGASMGRTVTYDDALGGDPLVNSTSDASGTLITRVDLVGRVVSTSDAWGPQPSTTTYDAARRVATTAGPAGTTASPMTTASLAW